MLLYPCPLRCLRLHDTIEAIVSTKSSIANDMRSASGQYSVRDMTSMISRLINFGLTSTFFCCPPEDWTEGGGFWAGEVFVSGDEVNMEIYSAVISYRFLDQT